MHQLWQMAHPMAPAAHILAMVVAMGVKAAERLVILTMVAAAAQVDILLLVVRVLMVLITLLVVPVLVVEVAAVAAVALLVILGLAQAVAELEFMEILAVPRQAVLVAVQVQADQAVLGHQAVLLVGPVQVVLAAMADYMVVVEVAATVVAQIAVQAVMVL